MTNLPFSVRTLLRCDRWLRRAQVEVGRLREDILLSCVPARLRASVTYHVYETYSAGASRSRASSYPSNLFDWERAAFEGPLFPRSGTVLVGGAGAGREVAWLSRRGYSVAAFEPSDLVEDTKALARTLEGSVMVCRGAYSDLICGINQREGRLKELCLATSADVVVLGWGSFSHIEDHAERGHLLAALRRQWPRATVFLSFFISLSDVEDRETRPIRRVLEFLNAPGGKTEGLRFMHESGFSRPITRKELSGLAERAGYEVRQFEETPFPHAFLIPRDPL